MWRSVAVAAIMGASATTALAQRTTDNAATQADDAFGKSVGNERVGIYNTGDVRGFSPEDAGNVRLEGLYFDKQAGLTDRLVDGSTVRVGLAAQGYPFPAPTGIAEYELRRAGDTLLFSPALTFGPWGKFAAELDAQIPIVKDKLGVAAGIGVYRNVENYGGTPHYLSVAVAPRWRPAPGIEIVPFWSRIAATSQEPQPLVLTAGNFLPPKVERLRYYGQDWAQASELSINTGIVGSLERGPWSARAGVFRSIGDSERSFASLFVDTQADGRSRELVIAFAPSRSASTSGEVRVARHFDEGNRRHTLTAMLRGRDQTRSFGGEQVLDLGATVIGVQRKVAEPEFAFGAQSRDHIRQGTAGLAYRLNWRDVGEFSVGVQKTDYTKATVTPTGTLPSSHDAPWLVNATAALTAIDDVVVYASYTRGLEESPSAPDIAVNRTDAPPAIRTRQVDAGVRWALRPDLKLVAGVFEVAKPFFDLDPSNVFGQVGEVTNRGIELSLAGSLAKGLNLVAGTVFLDPVVSGPVVDRGEFGRQPVGAILRNTFVTADYRFPDSGFSVDAVVESTGKRVANSENTLYVPPRAVLSLGGRYRFTASGKPVTVRVLAGNVFNNYGFGVAGGGLFVYNLPRRLTLNIAADI